MGMKDKVELPCPGGGSPLRTTYAEVCSRSSLRTAKGEYRFKSSDQYKLKAAFSDVERLQKKMEQMEQEIERSGEKIEEAFETLVENAEKVVK